MAKKKKEKKDLADVLNHVAEVAEKVRKFSEAEKAASDEQRRLRDWKSEIKRWEKIQARRKARGAPYVEIPEKYDKAPWMRRKFVEEQVAERLRAKAKRKRRRRRRRQQTEKERIDNACCLVCWKRFTNNQMDHPIISRVFVHNKCSPLLWRQEKKRQRLIQKTRGIDSFLLDKEKIQRQQQKRAEQKLQRRKKNLKEKMEAIALEYQEKRQKLFENNR